MNILNVDTATEKLSIAFGESFSLKDNIGTILYGNSIFSLCIINEDFFIVSALDAIIENKNIFEDVLNINTDLVFKQSGVICFSPEQESLIYVKQMVLLHDTSIASVQNTFKEYASIREWIHKQLMINELARVGNNKI